MSEVPTEIHRRDYPQKSHIIVERNDDGSVETACGLKFAHTGVPDGATQKVVTFDLEDETTTVPVPEARCGNCPWDEALEAVRGDGL